MGPREASPTDPPQLNQHITRISPIYADKIDKFILDNLKIGFSPTLDQISTFIKIESNGEVPSRIAKAYTRQRFEAYKTSRNMPLKTKRGKATMALRFGLSLGSYHMDIGFLTKLLAGFQPEDYACLLVKCGAGTHLTLLQTLKKGKDTASIIDALEACQERLRTRYNRPEGIKRIYADQEPSFRSKEMAEWLKQNKIEIVFYKWKAKKTFLAEGALRQLRVRLSRLGTIDTENPYKKLRKIEEQHNNDKLKIGKVIMPMSPAEITAENYAEFISYVRQLSPHNYFGLFDLGDSFWRWKFQLGDPVYLKKIYTSSKAIEKRSVSTVEADHPFRIASRHTVFCSNNTLQGYYKIVPALDLSNDIDIALDQEQWDRGLLVPEFALTAY